MGKEWTPIELLSAPAARVRGRIENFLRSCEAEAAESRTKFWGHKTVTEHIRGLRSLHPESPFAADENCRRQAEHFDSLGCFVEATKHIPVIYILRDGRACIRSKLKRGANMSPEEAIERWKFGLRVLDAYRQAGTKLLLLKMEDLVSMPEPTLRAVCDFIGMPYTPMMLNGTTSEIIPVAYRRPHFDVSVLAHDNPPWTTAIEKELLACGYAV